jgi:hypothetical protein
MDEREESKRRHSELLAVPVQIVGCGCPNRLGHGEQACRMRCFNWPTPYFPFWTNGIPTPNRGSSSASKALCGEHELPGRVDCYPDY